MVCLFQFAHTHGAVFDVAVGDEPMQGQGQGVFFRLHFMQKPRNEELVLCQFGRAKSDFPTVTYGHQSRQAE